MPPLDHLTGKTLPFFFFLTAPPGQPQPSVGSAEAAREIASEDSAQASWGSETGLHGSPLLHAWIQSLIPAPLTVRVGDRTVCRTDTTSTTSPKSMRRASSRLSGSCLSHNSKRAGIIHCSIVYLRAKVSRCKGFGGFTQRRAKSRMLVKPHRVERSRTEDHSSKERSSSLLKFLRERAKIKTRACCSLGDAHCGYKTD